MFTSGTSAVTTSGTGSVSLLSLSGGQAINRLVITNEGTNAGFFSIDAGQTWGRIPAATTAIPGSVDCRERCNVGVIIKRASADMAGVWAFGTYVD